LVDHPLAYSNQDFSLFLVPSICQISMYYFVKMVVVAVVEAVFVAMA